jgi:hypothetical protein
LQWFTGHWSIVVGNFVIFSSVSYLVVFLWSFMSHVDSSDCEAGVYPRRIAGGDRHHWRVGGFALAGGAGRAGGGSPHPLFE